MAEPKPFASLSSGLLARKGAARPAMRPQGFGQVGNGLEDLGWNDMGYESPKPGDGPRDATPGDFEQPPVYHPTGLTPVQSPVHDQQAELAGRLGIDPEDEDFDETAELYDPNAVDETAVEDEADEAEADELYEARIEEPSDVPAKPKKQPLQLSGGFDDVSQSAAENEPVELAQHLDEPSQERAEDEPFELTERFEDYDPFQETEEEPAPIAEFVPPPPAQVFQSTAGYSPAPAYQPTPRAAPGSKTKAAFTLRLDPDRHLKLRLACAVNGRSAQQIVTDAVDQLLRQMPELDAMAEKAKRKG